MIEPGYYNVIYDELGNQRKNIVSWHGHLLVWGIREKQLAKHLAKIKSRYTPARKLHPGNAPSYFIQCATSTSINWRWPVVKDRSCCGESNMRRCGNIEIKMAGMIGAHNYCQKRLG
jgi:hypothetical protein